MAIRMAEEAPIPDVMRRAGVDIFVGAARRRLARTSTDADTRFAQDMAARPIAEFTAAANSQHYEVPVEFFEHVLGPRLKYSCCLFPNDGISLADAEDLALAETCANADLADGQDILELGCGWGSLTLWMAQNYPTARITAVSNSRSQGMFIRQEAAALGLANVRVVTADANDLEIEGAFDRVVSVEMFEHMANWRALLHNVRAWLRPDGRLFLHVFTHRHASYRFDATDPDDWIAQHFFTGGLMPSHDLIRQFGDLFEVENSWRWSGRHYRLTAERWLENFQANRRALTPVFEGAYGPQAKLWARRWRLFFLATAGLFGHARGEVWGVSHYRLRRADL
jgi:cyclopropane-fatty-acyl-phospholipid synthase